MTALATPPTGTGSPAASKPWGRGLCAGTLVPFALSSLSGDTGAEVTAGLVDDATLRMVGSIVAVLVAAALFLAAVRLGRPVGVTPGCWSPPPGAPSR